MKYSYFLLVFLYSALAFGQTNHMLVLGGGSEPLDKETTIFDDSLRSLGNFTESNRAWTPDVLFNGGHSTTEAIIQNSFRSAKSNGPFTVDNFNQMLTNYETKIQNGEIKPGDQLMVLINTHGAMRNENEINGKKELSHGIAASGKTSADLNTLSGGSLISMDRLENLINLAESKGVKLGILDFSCHSGNSMRLQKPNTCIISATGPNHFGYNSYGDAFAKDMRPGKNLEEIFLDNFEDRGETAFPMISTPAGNAIQDELYPLLTPYLYYYDDKHDKLQGYIDGEIKNNRCEQTDRDFATIHELLNQYDEIAKAGKKKDRRVEKLRDAVSEYHEFQNQIKNQLKALNAQTLSQENIFECDQLVMQGFHDYPVCTSKTATIREIIETDFDKEAERLNNNISNATDEWQKAYNRKMLELNEKLRLKKAQAMSNPDIMKYARFFKDYTNLESKTRAMSLKVSRTMQDFYRELYREKSRTEPGPNPCRNFVL